MRLHGTLRLPDDGSVTGSEVARVRLLDVSRADAPAITVAEAYVPLGGRTGATEVGFDLEAPALETGATYALAAHVDMTGTGDITVGDLLTTQHVDVSPRDPQRSYAVPLQRVT